MDEAKKWLGRGLRWALTGVVVLVAVAYIFPQGLAMLTNFIASRISGQKSA